jgi:hypothetical protein
VSVAADHFAARREDWRRHVVDLQERGYDGAATRAEGEAVFRQAFELTSPVAVEELERLVAAYLGDGAAITVTPPRPAEPEELLGANLTPTGGLLGSWNLTWPELERARGRMTGEPLLPVQIFAMYPTDFTHGHLALFDAATPRSWIACWPFQVVSTEDAERQRPILSAIAEADMHDRTFASDLNWRLLDLG